MQSCSIRLRQVTLALCTTIIATTIGIHLASAAEPPPDTIQAVDWSKFQRGHTLRDMERLKAEGIELVIVGSWHGQALGTNAWCAGDLARARASGLKTALYLVVEGSTGPDPAEAVSRGLAGCGRESNYVSFIAIDAEVESITEERIEAAAARVRQLGKTPILYTAHWFWSGKLGNPQWACDLPLWNATYDFEPDFDFEKKPYGCWTADQVVGEQYSDESQLDGLVLDHNSFRSDFIKSVEPTPTKTATASPSPTATPTPAPYRWRYWPPLQYPGLV